MMSSVLYVSLKEGPFLSFDFERENKNNRYLIIKTKAIFSLNILSVE